jgi:hypothetical protein
MTIELKETADQYKPAQGYNYAVLVDEEGDELEDLCSDGVCCSGCRNEALALLKKEHGEGVEIRHIACNEEYRFPTCIVCGEIIETGFIYDEQEPGHWLSFAPSELKERLKQPYYAYQVWRLLDEYPEEELVKQLRDRI